MREKEQREGKKKVCPREMEQGVSPSLWFYHHMACARCDLHAFYSNVFGHINRMNAHRRSMHVLKERVSNHKNLWPLFFSLTFSGTRTHRRRFKQTHLCFIALICLGYSWLTGRCTESQRCETIHTSLYENNTHTRKVDMCGRGQSA